MRLLSLTEIVELHRQIIDSSGGSHGIRDLGALESAVAQPRMSFDGQDLYSTSIVKAAALGSSLVQNHPFIDGNKRAGHAAIEVTLVLNGFELEASIEEQEYIVLKLAAGKLNRGGFTLWVRSRVVRKEREPLS